MKYPEYYVITEWAEDGNLRDMWLRNPNPKMTASLVKEVLKQLLGLAEAFTAAHNLTTGGVTSGSSYRHGDLKPEYIPCFPDGSEIGTFKISDWRKAENKQVATAMRHTRTTARFGTHRYEPPEIETGVRSMLGGKEENRQSLLYDIWALGCITLKFLVWLLYGVDGLDHFNKSVKSELDSDTPFYQPGEHRGKKITWVHNVVRFWMKYMSEDAACRAGTTALGDLLEIVEAGLIIIKLPREGGSFFEPSHQQLIPNSSFGRLKADGITAVVIGSTASPASVESQRHNDSTEQCPSILVTAAQDNAVEGGAPRHTEGAR
ncbi:hypothetical protein BU23DRAFT_565914 [Bimuria novae-zelandiae CBS 107.79]|uniref:Protein kinase domain-containing protein n=1 Tax=Bimuria novae-zelandiae CBS 107.79 TaxID=1447943 RepID=A0A6A5VGC0_9PLEO|nr:hypothetical protein BU23DRAFT_565914 [Bimuria novae-zelandiae CBS 107.79]